MHVVVSGYGMKWCQPPGDALNEPFWEERGDAVKGFLKHGAIKNGMQILDGVPWRGPFAGLQSAAPVLVAPVPAAPVPVQPRDSESEKMRNMISAVLAQAQIRDQDEAALRWMEDEGAVNLDEVLGELDSFAKQLGLKKLQVNRL